MDDAIDAVLPLWAACTGALLDTNDDPGLDAGMAVLLTVNNLVVGTAGALT